MTPRSVIMEAMCNYTIFSCVEEWLVFLSGRRTELWASKTCRPMNSSNEAVINWTQWTAFFVTFVTYYTFRKGPIDVVCFNGFIPLVIALQAAYRNPPTAIVNFIKRYMVKTLYVSVHIYCQPTQSQAKLVLIQLNHLLALAHTVCANYRTISLIL